MTADGWPTDTRISYDTVAAAHADRVRDAIADNPYPKAALTVFADLVRGTGGARWWTWGAGRGTSRPARTGWASTPSGSTSHPG
ncbi:MAG TPA: hypothetical protein VIL00_05810 [Pseudonocardiaceae bacterium]